MSQSDANRMIADAEAAVAALAAEYVIYARDDLASLRRLYEAAAPLLANADAPVFCAQAAEMFSIVHNVKGQGGAFGYDLLTELGSSLCMRLRGRDALTAEDAIALEAHLDAMDAILAGELTGDGGSDGAALLDGLGARLLREE